MQLKPAYSDREEAMIVTQDIKRLKANDRCSWSDFAILYRTNSQSRSFEEQMRKDGIPYRIYGGLSFYQRKEIKDVIAYFRLIANPNDEEAFKRYNKLPCARNRRHYGGKDNTGGAGIRCELVAGDKGARAVSHGCEQGHDD